MDDLSLTGMIFKILEADRAQQEADLMMKKLFRPGTMIYFKCSGMKGNTQAKVIWARMTQNRAELKIQNLNTGKERKINFLNVMEII